MKRFVYFLLGGVLVSCIWGLLLIPFGEIFDDSGCLECSGQFDSNCEIVQPGVQCQLLGKIENDAKFSAYMSNNFRIDGMAILLIVYAREGLILGLILWVLITLSLLIKKKFSRQN